MTLSFAAGLGSRAWAYQVEPGSSDNVIRLQLEDRSGLLSDQPVFVDARASADWIEVGTAALREGRVREIEVRFAVGDAGPGSIGYIEVTARTGGLIASKRIPLEAAPSAPATQQSFVVDECCLPAAGLDPVDPSHGTRALLGSTPNPAVSLAHIVFDLGPEGGAARLKVYDVRGRLLRAIQTPALSAGLHRITWDGRDESGRDMPSGIYLYSIEVGDWTATRKLQLLR
ncbi:MAG: FlgD immunoglobulin-like domain containing protein [Candidatus Eisenbacteria bacterium]